jgi:hypothetical protein
MSRKAARREVFYYRYHLFVADGRLPSRIIFGIDPMLELADQFVLFVYLIVARQPEVCIYPICYARRAGHIADGDRYGAVQ